MGPCNHSQCEKDSAIADFSCPLCLGEEVDELRKELDQFRWRPISELKPEMLKGNGSQGECVGRDKEGYHYFVHFENWGGCENPFVLVNAEYMEFHGEIVEFFLLPR